MMKKNEEDGARHSFKGSKPPFDILRQELYKRIEISKEKLVLLFDNPESYFFSKI